MRRRLCVFCLYMMNVWATLAILIDRDTALRLMTEDADES